MAIIAESGFSPHPAACKRDADPERVRFIPIPVPIPAPLYGIGYLAYSWYAARNPHGRLNHDAHLGGAIAGLVYVALVAPGAYTYLFNNLF